MSNFKSIIRTHKEAQEQPAKEAALPSPAPTDNPVESGKKPKTNASGNPAKENKKPGRPSGKRSNPEFAQVTAYIRRDTHLAVQFALLKNGKTLEFSELVEELLSKWVTSRT